MRGREMRQRSMGKFRKSKTKNGLTQEFDVIPFHVLAPKRHLPDFRLPRSNTRTHTVAVLATVLVAAAAAAKGRYLRRRAVGKARPLHRGRTKHHYSMIFQKGSQGQR